MMHGLTNLKVTPYPKTPRPVLGVYPAFYSINTSKYSSSAKYQGREPNHSPHLVPRVRMSAAILLPTYAFTACIVTTVPLPLTYFKFAIVTSLYYHVYSRITSTKSP
jgi:hypothetical protein